MNARTIIDEYRIDGRSWTICKYAGRFFAIDKRDIDENGCLTKPYHLSFETYDKAIEYATEKTEYDSLIESGYDTRTAAAIACGLPLLA